MTKDPLSSRGSVPLSPRPIAFVLLLIPIAGLFVQFLSASTTAMLAAVIFTTIGIGMLISRWIGKHEVDHQKWMRNQSRELESIRRRLESLRQETEQATTALSKMRDGVVMLSPDQTIMLINPSAKQLLNLSASQGYLGRPFNEVVRVPILIQALATAESEPQTVRVEVPGGDKAIPLRVLIDLIDPVPDGGIMMALHDESESHRVDEIRREFVANISHELKTPLAAIKGYAETVELAIADDPKSAVHFLSQINAQCLRLERLISDMMQLARAQAGPENLNFARVTVSDVIAESLRSYRPIAEKKEVELVVLDTTDINVFADPDATLTIANNLIGNAIHYTPSGGRVTVFCQREGEFGKLVVADTGVGIPVDEQARIFERFYRVEKNRDTASGGTGIGLSMVKNLVNTMGGQVRLTSRPGQGATFEVLLPRS